MNQSSRYNFNRSLEIYDLRKKLKESHEEIIALKEQLRTASQTTTATTSKTPKPQSLWDDIEAKLQNDTDAIKSMMANKSITVHDVDANGYTLLCDAAYFGNWEIAQLCINLGADLNHRLKHGKTALDKARHGNNPHIEQLLLLSEMKANIGDKIKNISNSINKQNGIIENILNEINEYGETTGPFIKNTLIDIMIKVIEKKLVFSDDLLTVCWRLASEDNDDGDALKSKLWETIQRVCGEIITSSNKRDWFWLKNFMLTSNIWFTQNKQKKYLFYELLNLVEEQEKAQTTELGKDLKSQCEKDKASWRKLINLDIECEKLTELTRHSDDAPLDNQSDETKDDLNRSLNYDVVQFWQSMVNKNDKNREPIHRPIPRQDIIPNGLKATYNQQQLHQTATTTSFDGAAFYDYNQYLSQLALIAQSVDDEFHKSLQEIFGIDRQTKIGKIRRYQQHEQKYDDDDDIVIQYTRGPVKLLERARSKAQTDYFMEIYPTSANILDFNRCSLTFKNVPDLLQSVDLFINKIRAYQSGNIIGIVRLKNGFKKYVDEIYKKGPQYADIKINVMIRGNQHNIIGEVQFLLQRMLNFKKHAHNLYGITRNEEFYRLSVSKLLPTLTDSQQQLKVSTAMGDSRGILKAIIHSNQKIEDIMNVSAVSAVCKSGSNKALSLFSHQKDILKCLFAEFGTFTPIEWCLRSGHPSLIRDLFNIDGVRGIYAENQLWRYRAVFTAFVWCGNPTAIDVLMEELGLNKNTNGLKKLFEYKYPATDEELVFYAQEIVSSAVWNNSLKIIQKMAGILDRNQFINHVLKSDYYSNQNALEYAIERNKLDMIEYFLSLKDLRNRVMNDRDLRWRVIFWLNLKGKRSTIDYIVATLNIDEKLLQKIISHQPERPKYMTAWNHNASDYWNEQIGPDVIKKILNR